MDKPINVVSFRETIRQLLFVFPNAPLQITRYADVKAFCLGRENVDIILFIHKASR